MADEFKPADVKPEVKAQPAVRVNPTPAPKAAAPAKSIKIFNNHQTRTAHVKVKVRGKDDYVTVMPRGKVELTQGSSVHPTEHKNPNLRIV